MTTFPNRLLVVVPVPLALVGKSFPSVAVPECPCLHISGPPVTESPVSVYLGKSFPSVAVQECLCRCISGPPVKAGGRHRQ